MWIIWECSCSRGDDHQQRWTTWGDRSHEGWNGRLRELAELSGIAEATITQWIEKILKNGMCSCDSKVIPRSLRSLNVYLSIRSEPSNGTTMHIICCAGAKKKPQKRWGYAFWCITWSALPHWLVLRPWSLEYREFRKQIYFLDANCMLFCSFPLIFRSV